MDLTQATVLITGSTDGVGRLVAKRLAAGGARVILHGRSDRKGRELLDQIRRESPHSPAELYLADFASLEPVRRFADQVGSAHDRLNILINNAGIGFGPPGSRREISRDGHELRFAVNYLAPFLLTHLLLPALGRGAPSRIVNVASLAQAPIDFDDVMLTKRYDGRRAYAQSKLALVMFTFDLAEALRGTGVVANAIHPATLMNTGMVAEARGYARRAPSKREPRRCSISRRRPRSRAFQESSSTACARHARTRRRTTPVSGDGFASSRSTSPGFAPA